MTHRRPFRWLWCGVLVWLGLWACQQGSVPSSSRTLDTWGQRHQAIIGGVTDLRFPAAGALVQQGRPFCTGTLIRPDVVLTAAHCTRGKGSRNIFFRVDKDDGKGGFTSQQAEVRKIVDHSIYGVQRYGLSYDLSLVFLRKALAGVTPIPLNRQVLVSPPKVGSKLLFMGYGITRTFPDRLPAKSKQSTELSIAKVYADRVEVYERFRGLCNGDSGGPGFTIRNGKPVLTAITSYGRTEIGQGGARCNGSGVAFRVDRFLPWIETMISQNSGICQSNADCGSCGSCLAGKCVLRNQNRPQAPKYCKSCRRDADCGNAQYQCIKLRDGYRCLPKCDAKSCCPNNMFCKDKAYLFTQHPSTCVPNDFRCPRVTCTKDSECGKDGFCNGKYCDVSTLPRQARYPCQFCENDSQCMPTAKCVQRPEGKVCLETCGDKQPICGSGFACRGDNDKQKYCLPVLTRLTCRCRQDDDCVRGQVCRQGACMKPGPRKLGQSCQSSPECQGGLDCILGFKGLECVPRCEPAGTFQRGMLGSPCNERRCQNTGECFPIDQIRDVCYTTCENNSDCAFGGVCENVGDSNVCVCRSNRQCKRGSVCNMSQFGDFGACTPPPPNRSTCKAGLLCIKVEKQHYCLTKDTTCESDSDCASTRFCSRGRCIAKIGCSEDKPCPPGLVCLENGLCGIAPQFCTGDEDCGSDKKCLRGKCKRPVPEPTVEETPVESNENPQDAGSQDNDDAGSPGEFYNLEGSTAGEGSSTRKLTVTVATLGCGCHQTQQPHQRPLLWFSWLLLGLLGLWRSRRHRRR